MNKNWDINNLIDYSEGGILSKDLFKNQNKDLSLFCMAKGTKISDHTSTKSGFVYVLEGKGVFNLEGKDIEILSGVLIHIKANAVHSLKAEENTSFILILCG